MIYCVWYPSGGFGHFINAVLSLHGDNFARPYQQQIEFGSTGHSHNLGLAAPKYSKDTDTYQFKFKPDVNYSVLIDNGIDSNSSKFRSVFPDAQVYRLCYNDTSWPIVAKTLIVKAMKSAIEQELLLGSDWAMAEPWAQREKYFLFLRDHEFRHAWRPEAGCYNLLVDNFVNYEFLRAQLVGSGVQLSDFQQLHRQWLDANREYFNPVLEAHVIVDSIKNNSNYSLAHITDLWAQAVVYYFIWLTFGQEVPHNDYSNFFQDTDQIRAWLKL